MSRSRLTLGPGTVLKLLLLAVLVVAAVPSLRARALPHVAPALNPIRTVSAKDRVNRISRFIEHEAARTGMQPQGRDLPRVVRTIFPGREDMLLDPWGNAFYLRRRADGFQVASAGPDRRRGTADDILSPKRALPSARDAFDALR